jgi:pimeloyl-ACP methyl ester carboxylesterase
MGSLIALRVTLNYPDRILTSTLGGFGLERAKEKAMFGELADALESGKGIRPLIMALMPGGSIKPSDFGIEMSNRFFLAINDPKALAAIARSADSKDLEMSEGQLKTKLAAVNFPIQAVIGSEDPFRPTVDYLKKRMPALKVLVIDGADHVTAPMHKQFIQGLKDFLEKRRASQE